MLNFLIEDFDVFNEYSNGHEFIIFLVLFFNAQSFFLSMGNFRAFMC